MNESIERHIKKCVICPLQILSTTNCILYNSAYTRFYIKHTRISFYVVLQIIVISFSNINTVEMTHSASKAYYVMITYNNGKKKRYVNNYVTQSD